MTQILSNQTFLFFFWLTPFIIDLRVTINKCEISFQTRKDILPISECNYNTPTILYMVLPYFLATPIDNTLTTLYICSLRIS